MMDTVRSLVEAVEQWIGRSDLGGAGRLRAAAVRRHSIATPD